MHDRTDHPLDRRGVVLRYLCAVLPMLLWVLYAITAAPRAGDHRFALWGVLLDLGLGVVGLVLMRWRRRRPWQIAVATALLTAFSATACGPASVAYVSLCKHRRWRRLVPVAAVSWLCMAVYFSLHGAGTPTFFPLVTGTAVLAGLTVFGLYLGSSRDLAAARREEQRQRVEQAKLAERLKIAHEMHDVLAHRISLLSMLAGGLAYRTDLGADETRETALAIQENAHQSLDELRTVLGSLRRDGAPEAPQPNLTDLPALFDEVHAAGQQADLADSIHDRQFLPAQTGRHAYRIVQEALTNARKHAPGSRVTAELGGRPGHGLTVRVSNPAPYGITAGPGGRLGLVGLAERIRMAGGTLTHTLQNGRFVLDAHLPWDAPHSPRNS